MRLNVQYERFYAMDLHYRTPSIIINENVRGTAILTSETPGGQFYYTLDGTEASAAMALRKWCGLPIRSGL